MFGYILGGITALVFGGIAYKEVTKPTGEKVKDGDSVFVNANNIHVQDITNSGDPGALQAFLAGFVNTAIKVTNVHQPVPPSTELTGTILGFPRLVAFPRTAVASIERNGARIV